MASILRLGHRTIYLTQQQDEDRLARREWVLASGPSRLSNAVVQNQTTSDSWQQLLEMPRKSWWARLPFGVRMAAGASAVLVVVGAGVAGVMTMVGGDGRPAPRIVTEVNQAAPAVPVPVPVEKPRLQPVPKNDGKADIRVHRARPKRVVPGVTPSAVASVPTGPVQTTQTQIETKEIPYETRTVPDPALPRGAERVEAPGVNGVETLRYLVTLTNGRPTARKLIDAVVTRQPQHQVVALGTQSPDLGTRRPMRDCGGTLDFCGSLGRRAVCPDQGRPEDVSIPLPDLVVDSGDLGYLEGLAC
ncbi:G5 domain-containing protein [Actinoplanes subtropicus]|uniref:G5 domain-containing protein n=1 Tax=Actinoplanes subtropicus TaxID=543632 RepID=UPI000A07A32F|nr:G5 domain-containing protein [Actinoplanes subtropicus]